jgi:hypothetical protein
MPLRSRKRNKKAAVEEKHEDDAPTSKKRKAAPPSESGMSAASGENVEAGTETQGKKFHTQAGKFLQFSNLALKLQTQKLQKTVVLSSGEQPLISTKNSGTSGRKIGQIFYVV